MGEEKYFLYGAAVQGIQSFIFQANELKDIVGASELVEEICTTAFARLLYDDSNTENDKILKRFFADDNRIISAAGNIKYILNEKDCMNVVREFPKKVMQMAPGITISQAVVKMEGEYYDYAQASNELEKRLHIQRNKQIKSMTIGLMSIRRSYKTGLPVIDADKNDFYDKGTVKKREAIADSKRNGKYYRHTRLTEKTFGKKLDPERITDNIDQLTSQNDWIAIIHIDGNGLGQVVSSICTSQKISRAFSMSLNDATIESAHVAFETLPEKGILPCRPIIIGGDDLTIVIRGDLAIPYVETYLYKFEEETKKLMGGIASKFKEHLRETQISILNKGLTACAGIAFIKSSYPFYYGYGLAEALCDRAKKDAKKDENKKNGLALSCLMFHKVQDSFVTNFDAVVKRELQPTKNISFEFGPYYLNDAPKDSWKIDDLTGLVKELEVNNAIKSHLRQWMTVLHDDGQESASQLIIRLKTMVNEGDKWIVDKLVPSGVQPKYAVYDVLSLLSVINQETKEIKKEDDK
jgi:CRISPR/Cas system-associated protein Cas10 (large subunit of type III CRISPR-Cas system)